MQCLHCWKEELSAYLRNTLVVTKSAHQAVVYDSQLELGFAQDPEGNLARKCVAYGLFRIHLAS